jgi:two-component system OmpR family sensor kinase
VLANLELLEPELSGEEREIARSALRSAERMRRRVADLLALARADAAKEGRNGSRAQRTRVEMGELVREAVAELAPLAEHHELTVDLREPVFVVAERDELLRAITNLVENALVHTPPGTHVRVAVGSEHGTALLVVEDDGPGIPPAAAARIFERFTRGTTEVPGNGLGLAIVRAVAEGHGGSVVLVHRPDPGTRFELRLPSCDEQRAAHAPVAADAQAGR